MGKTKLILYGLMAAIVIQDAAFGQPAANAQAAVLSPEQQCAAIRVDSLRAALLKAKALGALASKFPILPGGLSALITSPGPAGTEVRCVMWVEENLATTAQDVAGSPDDARNTQLRVKVPNIRFGWPQPRHLIVVSYPVADGKLKLDAPSAAAERRFWVSNGPFSVFIALLIVAIAYLCVVFAVGRFNGRYSPDPVYLTSDQFDRASLSQLQIFGFTLVVLGLLTYILLRVGLLSEISEDILVLLGISAVGAAGAKVADTMKKRLSFENWAWLRNNRWLTVYEAGVGQASDPKRARWRDLLTGEGGFDVYSFQLASFSVVVAYALVTTEFERIATFTIPEHLKALLGLSNAVYIGGKAITPNSIGELNQKVKELREAEDSWLSAVLPAVQAASDPAAKMTIAIANAPEKYKAYITRAREAARMLKSIYGSEGTKFAQEPIPDGGLLPQLP